MHIIVELTLCQIKHFHDKNNYDLLPTLYMQNDMQWLQCQISGGLCSNQTKTKYLFIF